MQALLELESTAKKMPTSDPKPSLLPFFERLDMLARQLPRGANPQLAHYLSNKSYEKARLLLQGKDAENARGACR